MKARFCPKCKSLNVRKNGSSVGADLGWECLNCGFKVYVFPEGEIKKEKKK